MQLLTEIFNIKSAHKFNLVLCDDYPSAVTTYMRND